MILEVIFNTLTNPVVSFLTMLTLGIALKFFRWHRAANTCLIVLFFWFWLIGCSPAMQLAMAKWEHQFKPLTDTEKCEDASFIVVLGAGHAATEEQPPLGQLVNVSIVRLSEGFRLYNMCEGKAVVVSGNGNSGKEAQASVAARALIGWGVLPRDTIMLPLPENTEQELNAFKNRFGADAPFILVTSALHMPRAMLICRREGMRPIPAPTDYYFKSAKILEYNFKPSIQKVMFYHKLLHEWGGIMKLKIFG